MTQLNLLELPAFYGIITKVFGNLETEDLLNCKLVCHTFYYIVENERKIWVDLLKRYPEEYGKISKDPGEFLERFRMRNLPKNLDEGLFLFLVQHLTRGKVK